MLSDNNTNTQLLLDVISDYRVSYSIANEEIYDAQKELESKKSALKNEQIKNAGILKIIESSLDKIKPVNPPGDWRLWAYGTAQIYFKDQLSLWNYYMSNKDNLNVGDQ